MPKSDIATISPLLMLTGLMVPAFTSSYVTSRKYKPSPCSSPFLFSAVTTTTTTTRPLPARAGPMETFIAGLTLKMFMSVVLWGMVQYTSSAYADPEQGPSLHFLVPLVAAMLVIEVAGNLVFISIIAFFSKISDPSIGASYMTLLNTLTNLGSKWITSLSLYLLPQMTFYVCESGAPHAEGGEGGPATRLLLPHTCSAHDSSHCAAHGGTCVIELVRNCDLQRTLEDTPPFVFCLRSVDQLNSFLLHAHHVLSVGWIYCASSNGLCNRHSMVGDFSDSRFAPAIAAAQRLAYFFLRRQGKIE